MILAWGLVEDILSQMVVQQFEFESDPKKPSTKIEVVTNLPFRDKLEFLHRAGGLSAGDFQTFQQFAEEHTRLFREDINMRAMGALPEEEKTKLMQLAQRSARLSMDLAAGYKKGK